MKKGGRRWRLVSLAVGLVIFLAAQASADYVVQLGAFRDTERAQRLAEQAREAGWPVQVRPAGGGRALLLVQVGPVASRGEAEAMRQALLSLTGAALVLERPPEAASVAERTSQDMETEETIALSQQDGEESSTGEGIIREVGAPAHAEAPADMDALFGLGEVAEAGGETPVGDGDGVEALFGLEAEGSETASGTGGYLQSELAYTFGGDAHWSKFRNLAEVHARGGWGEGNGWWLGMRAWFDPVYAVGDYYPEAVRDDQGFEADIREAYLDFSSGDWDFRLGRQHIVWGETVGLFFADVVSAKDLREFVLVDFDYLRIPQWAARGEYFRGDFHAEAIWIPVMSYNKVGRYGADFFPVLPPPPPGYGLEVADAKRPDDTLENSGYGLRLSYLWSGWDVSGFYFNSPDLDPAFSRQVVGGASPRVRYTPVHERVARMGGTFAKDVGTALLKGEIIYTRDRPFGVLRFSEPNGLVPADLLDYVVGIDYTTDQSLRFNFQFFGRYFTRYDQDFVPDRHETGVSVLASREFSALRLEPELLFIHSLKRSDWLLSAKVAWRLDESWRLRFGFDLLQGPATGLFGRFADKDRVFSELRYSF